MKKLIAVAALLIAGFLSVSFQNKTVAFYIGTSDRGANSSVSLCELNMSTGQVTLVDTFNQCVGPGYVAISPDKKNLYAVGGDKVVAFAIGADKKLTYLNSESSNGAGPCHVSVHNSGKAAYVSNYGDGSFAAYGLGADGKVTPATYTQKYEGKGPNEKRQEKAHAHFATATPDGKFVYATDLGSDKIMNYVADKNGALKPNPAQPFFSGKPGAGPRHLIIHPSGKSLFLLNELEATLTSCSIDKNGVITSINTYPTIPVDYAGPTNTSSAIHLHPNGKFVYVSNRGHNSISAFKIGANGVLEMVDQQTKNIATPRDFNIDPSGKFMIVANQATDNLVIYDVDAASGKFSFRQESIGVKAPICVAFL